MKSIKIIIVLMATAAISIVTSVSSQAAEKRLALVIGNADYKRLSPLTNTINDANDMEKTLRNLNFEVLARVNTGLKDMEDIIREFGAKLRKNDVGLFYYSGHGIQYNGVNYLIPTDADIQKETDLKYKAVQADMVLDEMDAAGSNRMNIVILDACRDNPFPRSFKSARKGLAQMNAPSGMLIAYATSPDSVAFDGSGRNGTYTANLLKYMTVRGLKIEEVFKKVRIGVLKDSNNNQRPWEAVSITGDFYFVVDKDIIVASLPQPENPKEAILNVTADVSDAEVWVNGKKYGQIPRKFTFSDPGKYEIEVTAPGYKKYQVSKEIELGREYKVEANLEKEASAPVKPKYPLRSNPITVSSKEEALEKFKLINDKEKLKPLEYMKNDLEDNGDDATITDHATGLIWQKSGSDAQMDYQKAQAYINDLNRKKFADYNDWRIPTTDELKSLLMPDKQSDGLYINPIFNKIQKYCWASDKYKDNRTEGMWYVSFERCRLSWELSHIDKFYVRAVRSLIK